MKYYKLLTISAIFLSMGMKTVVCQDYVSTFSDMSSIQTSITSAMQNSMSAGMNSFQQISQLSQNSPLNVMENMQTLISQNPLLTPELANYFSSISQLAPQQFQLVNDMMSLLQPDSLYSKMMSEKQIHEESFQAAYRDIESAMQLMTAYPDSISTTSQNFLQVKDHILSAVQHMQDSCPLCRALKYAVFSDPSLLPLFTTLSGSILQNIPSTIKT